MCSKKRTPSRKGGRATGGIPQRQMPPNFEKKVDYIHISDHGWNGVRFLDFFTNLSSC